MLRIAVIAFACTFGALCVVILALSLLVWLVTLNPRPIALTSGLPGDVNLASRLFDERVRAISDRHARRSSGRHVGPSGLCSAGLGRRHRCAPFRYALGPSRARLQEGCGSVVARRRARPDCRDQRRVRSNVPLIVSAAHAPGVNTAPPTWPRWRRKASARARPSSPRRPGRRGCPRKGRDGPSSAVRSPCRPH